MSRLISFVTRRTHELRQVPRWYHMLLAAAIAHQAYASRQPDRAAREEQRLWGIVAEREGVISELQARVWELEATSREAAGKGGWWSLSR